VQGSLWFRDGIMLGDDVRADPVFGIGYTGYMSVCNVGSQQLRH
jgi:hypothetical protein